MFLEKEETLRRLEAEAVRLHRVQLLVQNGASCTRLMHEINSTQKALTSVRKEWLKYTLRNSLSVLQDPQDNKTQMDEIRKLFEIFSEAPNY